jgi:hypothetical protein
MEINPENDNPRSTGFSNRLNKLLGDAPSFTGQLALQSEPIHAFHSKSRLIGISVLTSMGSAFFGYNQAIIGIVYNALCTPLFFFVYSFSSHEDR